MKTGASAWQKASTKLALAAQTESELMQDKILRLPDVKAATGLSRSTIYKRISEGTFPEPIALGARARGFLESEVDGWLHRQIEASRGRVAE